MRLKGDGYLLMSASTGTIQDCLGELSNTDWLDDTDLGD